MRKKKIVKHTKENLVKKKNQGIILFKNGPIDSDKEDVFGFKNQVTILNEAITIGSHIIGIIGDYGSGKSSITEFLGKDRLLKNDTVIRINLWDQFETYEEKDDKENIFKSLTKAFLYQLAYANNRNNTNFAKYINNRFNTNNGKISFSFASRKAFGILAITAIFFVLFFSITYFSEQIEEYFSNMSGHFTSFSFLDQVLFISHYGRYGVLLIGIIFLIISLIIAAPVFTSWRSEGVYKLENSDFFETYTRIITRLVPFYSNQKCIVFIDDLDRTEEKIVVVSFLKEIYRCIYLLPKNKLSRIVFILSLKDESSLKYDKLTNPEALDLYPKIFDYTMYINPIHCDNYYEIVVTLIEQKLTNLISMFGELNSKNQREESDRVKDKVLSELFWIYSDENVSLREIKDRLNETFFLFQLLISRGLPNSSVRLDKCAAVVFLRRKYNNQYSILIKKEKEFADLVRKCCTKSDNLEEYAEIDDFLKATGIASNNQDFSKAFKKMLIQKLIDDDFKMYFYSYPKNSYIKTIDEKELFDSIIHNNNDYLLEGNILEKNKKVLNEKGGKVLVDAFDKYAGNSVPSLVYKNEEIFKYIIEFLPKIRDMIYIEALEEIKTIANDENIPLNILICCLHFGYDEQIKKDICAKLSTAITSILTNSTLEFSIKIRKRFIKLAGKNITHFLTIFTNVNIPMFTLEEYESIADSNIQLELLRALDAARLENFDQLGLISLSDSRIIEHLYEYKQIRSILLSATAQNKLNTIKLSSDWIYTKFLEIASEILQINKSYFIEIRFFLYIGNVNKANNFFEVYNEPFPLITNKELMHLNVSELYYYIDHSKIDIDNCIMLSHYCNDKKLIQDDLYLFYESLFFYDESIQITDANVIKKIITSINYEEIVFSSMNDEQVSKVLESIGSIFNIETVNGSIDFMRSIHCLITSLENNIGNEIENDDALLSSYLGLLNELKNVTETSISIINNRKILIGLVPAITDKLYSKNYYMNYIIAKTLFDKYLSFNESIPISAYFEVFINSDECYQYFKKNDTIINTFYSEKLYLRDIPKEKLFCFYKMRQPFDLVRVILQAWNGNIEEQKKYLYSIIHFDTEKDAGMFINEILKEEYITLLNENNLFYFIWLKMWNPSQKKKLTTKVNDILGTTYHAEEAYNLNK